MPYIKNDPAWAKGVPLEEGGTEESNKAIGGWLDHERLNHMEDGIGEAYELAEAAQKLADENKTAMATKANAATSATKAWVEEQLTELKEAIDELKGEG